MSPPPEKKRKTAATTPQSQLITIPYDLLLNIVARVPILYYPILSLVSKSFRSLIDSPELYKARSCLGHTEKCIYVCFEGDTGYRWFKLTLKSDKTRTNEKPSAYALATVPVSNSPPTNFSSLVPVGSDIYNIAGSVFDAPSSSSVWILDCRTHTWREAPSLHVELTSVSANVLDGRIYVVGRYTDEESDSPKDFFEALDTKSQIWDPLPANCNETKGKFAQCRTVCIDEKFHVMTWHEREVVAYNIREGRWELAESMMKAFMSKYSYCPIGNVLYATLGGKFGWYDTEVGSWRPLMDDIKVDDTEVDVNEVDDTEVDSSGNLSFLEELPHDTSLVRLADHDGKIAVFFVKDCDNKKIIWYAKIALRIANYCQIFGEVEYFDPVLTLPKEYVLVKALTTTL